MHAAWALQEAGYDAIMINSNPETVSTDFDTSDRLYFEPLDARVVREILENEGRSRQATAAGHRPVRRPDRDQPRRAADRARRDASSAQLAATRSTSPRTAALRGLPAPASASRSRRARRSARSTRRCDVAERIGYPVLVRPSYVLGGRAMEIVQNADHLARYIRNAADADAGSPGPHRQVPLGKEVEVDAICDGEEVLIPGIMEHIERAGVHSGDSFAVYPGINLYPAEIDTIVEYTTRIALAINARGLMNIQYVIHAGRHLRARGQPARRPAPCRS